MRIGIDIDGVLTDVIRYACDYGSKYFYEKYGKLDINMDSWSLKDMFKKRTLSPQEIKQAERVRKAKDTLLEFQAPEGLFQKCNCCGKPVYNEDLIENDYVCPVCGNYFRIRPKTRIAMVLDKDTFEERYVSVPEQGSSTLIPEGMCNPGQVYTVSTGKSGMIGLFRLESQTLPGNGKFICNGIGNEREARESTQNAFNYLKANINRISQSIGTTTKDFIVQYQDLQGIGMTSTLALPTLIALCSIALQKPTVSSLAILGEISVSGTVSKVENLANTLQVCLDSGAKKVLLPITSAVDLGTVPAELVGCFNLIFFNSAEDAVFKALGVD